MEFTSMHKINEMRLLERFLRYVQIDTTAGEPGSAYPSSPGQLELGRVLVAELQEIGLTDVSQSEFGIVMATVPATIDRTVPTIVFNSHLDTSPETSGKNVRPQVIRNYDGSDIWLPGTEKQIFVSDNPALKTAIGRTIITTDGTTLLGADDKAGVAVIVEAAAWLIEHPEIPHGPIRVLFTCDEEVGHGVDHVDLAALNATAAYTLDGSGAGEIDVETFSADLATITIRGINIHPSIAKGRMVNAVRVASDFLQRLPRSYLSPETTSERKGFVHPYTIEGGVAEVVIRILLRDFEADQLARHAELLYRAAAVCRLEHPKCQVDVNITPQYRNMAEGLGQEPRAVEYAKQAFERLGRPCRLTIVRGGTDGSRLTELGLPTPNLSCGQHNPHSPLEWACLEEMREACEHLVELARIWGEA
jgi:tripeptide aminopeptidase